MTTVITTQRDAAGILTLTFDDPARSMNVLSDAVVAEFKAAVDAAAADAAVKGILIRSGKAAFIAGADLKELATAFDRKLNPAEGYALSQEISLAFRRLETLGKPVAVAIGGTALGGGFELCLACHYRVLADDPKAVVGLPEVKVGLLPGAGGTQRLPRLIGIAAALPLLAEGGAVKPAQALKLGLVHAVAPAAEIEQRARDWLASAPEPTQPWDRKGYKLPGGGITNPAVAQTFMVGSALAAKTTQRNYPAPISILSAVFEGSALPIDTALKVESRYFARLLTGAVARNLIRTMFINKGAADKLAHRPAGVPVAPVRRLGIIGAGMMGGGIAHVAAAAGIEVILLDHTRPFADKGKGYSEALVARDVERGRLTPERAAEQLARIRPTADYADLAAADFVIEAVFEQRDIKAEVTRQAEAVIAAGTTFASNTSTLPITQLALAAQRPARFVGMHFFSPVEKMPLVEIIVGKKTAPEAVAHAMDLAARLKKTPIVVNDGRGFYTTRVFGAYTAEGMKMLEEGVDPALIENAAVAAGMPVGPLAVSDEVTLELQYKAALQAETDLGPKFVAPVNYAILKKFVLELQRIGRRAGHGFYEYPPGGKKHLWPGLAGIYPRAAAQPSVDEVKLRLLHVQALESARCVEEGVILHAADADLGSILGVGFPAYTGGTLSYIDTIGIARFVAETAALAKRHGSRFKPSRWLRARAAAGTPFHAPIATAESGS
ncbi:MAG: enoyl-CoA hydratase/isomerase family protein [Gammaproteobacteria bacterium]|nr:enoyl-CoA hydratase/isomerase family protein [Gammaproteobacteria bacterium]